MSSDDREKGVDLAGGIALENCVLVTGNAHKITEARRILGGSLDHADLDLPEIQSLDLAEVLEAKAKDAYAHLSRPVIVEETGLFLDSMGGFPGPLIKWMLDAMGPVDLARAAHGLGDPRARAVCRLAYFDGQRMITAEGESRGRLVTEARGDQGFGWDPVLVPEESSLTFAELSPEQKDRWGHRGRAWRAFKVALSGRLT